MLHAGHLLVFSNQVKTDSFASVVSQSDSWTTIHVFAPECTCSRFLIEDFLSRSPLAETEEVIITLGPLPDKEALTTKGYRVIEKTIEELKQEEKVLVEGVPFLALVRPDKTLAYAGGYEDHKIGPQTEMSYLELISELRKEKSIDERPIKGCAIADKYRRALSPFGFKITSITEDQNRRPK